MAIGKTTRAPRAHLSVALGIVAAIVAQLSLVALAQASNPLEFLPPGSGMQSADKGYSLKLEGGASGPVYRFEVRPGDRWGRDLSAAEDKERSEIIFPYRFPKGTDIWVGFSMQVENEEASRAKWVVIGQIHSSPPPGVPRSPPVSQQLNGSKFSILAEWQRPGEPRLKARVFTDPKLESKKWYEFIYHVRFSLEDGLLDIWRDGQQIVTYRGPLGYSDELGNYVKLGIYRHASDDTLVVRYKDITVGTKPIR